MLYEFLISLALFFICFNLFTFLFPLTNNSIYNSLERVEEFIYSRTKYKTVLVGSGLIADLYKKGDLENSFNLNFPYYGSCTGIRIIALSNKIPNRLIIEINYIFKGFDEQLITKVFQHPWYQLKFLFPIILKKNNPFKLVKKIIKYFFKKTNEADTMTEEFDENSYNMFIHAYKKIPEPNKFECDIKQLEKDIKYLYSRGCEIIFVEIPTDKLISQTELFKYQREKIIKTFHKDIYKWIPTDLLHAYKTTDGIHLTRKSKEYFAIYLLNEIAKMTVVKPSNIVEI